MRTVYHPTFTDVSFVIGSDVERDWKAAGWRFTPIPAAKAEGGQEPPTAVTPDPSKPDTE